MSSSPKKSLPEQDPYEVLGISSDATDAEIAKAYRKLALQYHPDKQRDASTRADAEAKFQNIQQARSFLLDAEFEKDRQKYRAKRASEQMRREADAAREKAMSAKRKRLRDELQRQEAAARKREPKNDVEELRRRGNELRQEYAARETERAAQDAVQQKELLEQRQIRLKWSRKKLETSPSEHSIAEQLSGFGRVESVQMLGTKGNAALVTFVSRDSCTPCVEHYRHSEQFRAKYVGRRAEDEEAEQRNAISTNTQSNDREGVEDWKLRRAAEREQLLRQLEREEEEGRDDDAEGKFQKKKKKRTAPFPPMFPDEYKDLSPFEQLERAEVSILKGLVSDETIAKLRWVQ